MRNLHHPGPTQRPPSNNRVPPFPAPARPMTVRCYYSVRRSCTMSNRRHTPLMLIVAVLLVPFIFLRSCSRSRIPTPRPARSSSYALSGGSPMSFAIRSTAFPNGGAIAARYTCDGAGLSPALSWGDVPAGAQSLALIADDPDAPVGTWTHWIVWNIPARATVLPRARPRSKCSTTARARAATTSSALAMAARARPQASPIATSSSSTPSTPGST